MLSLLLLLCCGCCGHFVGTQRPLIAPGGTGAYTTYSGLVEQESIPKPESVVPVWDGSINDIVNNHNIPQDMVVVGKIVTAGDGNNGYVAPSTLKSYLTQALEKFPSLGGVMGWQWGSDTTGAWAETMASAFK